MYKIRLSISWKYLSLVLSYISFFYLSLRNWNRHWYFPYQFCNQYVCFSPLSEKKKIFNFYLSPVSPLNSHLPDWYFPDFWIHIVKENLLHFFFRQGYNLLQPLALFSKCQLFSLNVFSYKLRPQEFLQRDLMYGKLCKILYFLKYVHFIFTFKCYKWMQKLNFKFRVSIFCITLLCSCFQHSCWDIWYQPILCSFIDTFLSLDDFTIFSVFEVIKFHSHISRYKHV